MNNKIKVGVIGLGVGQRHIEGYLEHRDCEVKAICDFQKDKLNYVSRKFSIANKTTQPQDILDDPEIDIISICSYDNYHAEQVIHALKNGKHVMVEKPICLNKQEAKRIIKVFIKSGKKLTSNLILRKSPRFISLKKGIEKKYFGEIFYVEGDYIYGRAHKIYQGWRGNIDFYCGVYGGGVHVIDLLLWLVNSEVIEVFSYGNRICSKNSNFKFDDCIVSLLKFKNGCVGKTLTTLSCVQPHFHSIKIYGTKATFINDYGKAHLYRNQYTDGHVFLTDKYPAVKKSVLISDFIDSIIYNKKQYINEKEVFRSMSVCFALYDSLISGKPVKVEYLM